MTIETALSVARRYRIEREARFAAHPRDVQTARRLGHETWMRRSASLAGGRRQRSRPRTSIVSKSGGVAVWPVTTTRRSMKRFAGLQSEVLSKRTQHAFELVVLPAFDIRESGDGGLESASRFVGPRG